MEHNKIALQLVMFMHENQLHASKQYIAINKKGDKAYLTREDAEPISSGILTTELNDTSSDFKRVSLWKETSDLSDINDFPICNRHLAK